GPLKAKAPTSPPPSTRPSTGPRNKDSNTKGKGMGEHALERLEKWLGDKLSRRVVMMEKISSQSDFVAIVGRWERVSEGRGYAPDLAAAIHAALDRAEEAGL